MDLFHNVTYRESLQIYTVDQLKNLAKRVGLKKLPTKKGDIIYKIADTSRKLVIEAMNDTEKLALSTAVYDTDGVLNLSEFKAQHGVDPYERTNKWRSNPSVLDLYIIDRMVVPTLIPELKKLLPSPPKNRLALIDSPAAYLESYDKDLISERHTAKETWRNIKTTLQLIDSGKVSLSVKTGIPSAATVRMIDEHLINKEFESHYIQAYALPLLIKCAGYASFSGSKLTLSAKGKKILTGKISQEEVVAHLWKSWSTKGTIDELSRISLIKGQKRKGTLTAPKGRRSVINETLKTLPAHKWIDIEELGRFMRASGNSFEVARDPWKLYFYDSNYGSLGYDGCGDWNILQERYIKTLFLEYYATIGLIDIIETTPSDAECDWGSIWGLDSEDYISIYDGLLAFRINNLGAYVFGITSEYETVEEETPSLFEILPNNDIVVTNIHELQPIDKLYLDKFAKKSSDVVWQISMKSILTAVESGETIEDIKQFLTNRAHRELSKTVEALFHECQSRVVPLKNTGNVALIECKDREFITRISHDPKMKEFCIVAEEFIIIRPSKEKQFFKRINTMGYAVPQKDLLL